MITQLECSGAPFCDFVVYAKNEGMILHRIYPDPALFDKLKDVIFRFWRAESKPPRKKKGEKKWIQDLIKKSISEKVTNHPEMLLGIRHPILLPII